MKFDNIWYSKHPLARLLAPLSWLFCAIVQIRRQAYSIGLLTKNRLPVPIIIVGNLTVGGTGKTPIVIALAQFFKKQGFKPGIVSRGYGGRAKTWPQPVYPDSDPRLVGDEPVLLARHSGCPVAVAPKRIAAVQSLLDNEQCNVIISDDGLQHYKLHRDIEIAVLDDIRRYGNGRCLPAGPLREPLSRLKTVDIILIKSTDLQSEPKKTPLLEEAGFLTTMTCELIIPDKIKGIVDEQILHPLSTLRDKPVHAIAGIAYPARFFNSLRDLGLKPHCHTFPDHHDYQASDIHFNDGLPVIMTEKDAVKCQQFAGPQHWYLPITIRLPQALTEHLLDTLKRKQYEPKTL
jgi:tetraacyldisaccharide 4'-kinase